MTRNPMFLSFVCAVLVYPAGPPSWTADGQWISYVSKQRGSSSIFKIRPDGTGLKQITPDGWDKGWHAWSPDGKHIVFDGTRDGNNDDIYMMSTDGSNIRRLTDSPKVEQAPVFVQVIQQ